MENPFNLSDTEVTHVRAALLAMPAAMKRAMRQTTYRFHEGVVWENIHGRCIIGQGLDAIYDEYFSNPRLSHAIDVLADCIDRDLTASEEDGLRLIIELNDSGQLRTQRAVRELLALQQY